MSRRDSAVTFQPHRPRALRVLPMCVGAALLCSALTSCNRDTMTKAEMKSTSAVTRGESTKQQLEPDWKSLATMPIYFGHQSVGRNLVDGLREMTDSSSSIPLRIVHSRERAPDRANTLVEFLIGENGRAESKLTDFAAALEQIGDTGDAVALFKYCYLDITAATDVEALFARHRDAVRTMRVKHPNLTFIHVTAPLTTLETGPRYVVKRLLGKSTTRDANARRNEFNARIRNAYRDEPIFDLAQVESTRPDGSRSFFRIGADTVHTLAPELTDDGGHLNATGRRAAATEFAAVVARAVTARRMATRTPSAD